MKSFVVAAGGVPACHVAAPRELAHPAQELEKYLCQITGARTMNGPALIRMDIADHGQGFARRMEGDALVLEAKDAETMDYGVYDLLESLAGCGFYTSDCEVVPENPDLVLQVEDYAFTPILGFREVYYEDYKKPEFAAKRKTHPAEAHAGWGFWCHSLRHQLLNPEKYFDEHPEYFGMIDGVRRKDAQPCLSNPQVLEIVCKELREYVDAQPDKLYWSVSQDDHDLYCRCPACSAVDEEQGTPMGSMLTFVNQVAERFPDKIISTLAYWYTRKPPKTLRPAKNVHIMLCNIEALRNKPLTQDPANRGTVEELQAWAAICGNVFLWDYCIQFANLVSPFPNLRVLAPNIRFFVQNSVRSLFSQSNREIGGEMCELRGYLLSRLMWDPDCDEKAVAWDFLTHYYGPAAEYIGRYLQLMHDASEASNAPLGIFHGPLNAKNSYLTPELIARYDAFFDQAAAAVEGQADYARRVNIARMPLRYAKLQLHIGTKAQRLAELAGFAAGARDQGTYKVEEWHYTVEQFVTDKAAQLGRADIAITRENAPAEKLVGRVNMVEDGKTDFALVAVTDTKRMMAEHTRAYMELPEGLYTAAYRKADAADCPEGALYVDFPGGDCMAVRFEEQNKAQALAALEEAIAQKGLIKVGAALMLEKMGDWTVYQPVKLG